MPARLDHIFSYVNEIESRANRLTDSVSQSNDLINTIAFLNQTASKFDQTIDELGALIEDNTRSLNEFKSLHERAFYLDSNLLHNEGITNQQTFEHITQEYIHLLGNLRKNDDYCMGEEEEVPDEHLQDRDTGYDMSQSPQQPCNVDPPPPLQPPSSQQPEQEQPFIQEQVHPPDLKKMISISNLRLKPMRCASSTNQSIAKKKSRYRLSSIYNINPVAYDDSVVGASTASSTSSSTAERNTTASSTQDYDHSRMQNSVTNSYETLESHLLDAGHGTGAEELMGKNRIGNAYTPDSDHIIPRGRSNSLPTSTTKDCSFSETDILKDFDCEVDILRFNRLKHFISVSHLPNKHNYGDEIHIDEYDIDNDEEGEDDDDGDIFFNDIYNKSPTPQSRHSNAVNDDVVSIVSDFSYYSPDKQQHHSNDDLFDYDNFNGFLRKSRLDLNKDLQQAFPHLMKPPTPEPLHPEVPRLKYKFHNPIEKQLSSSQISTATLNVQASAVMQTKNLQHATSLPYLSTSTTNTTKSSASSILHSYIEKPPLASDTTNHSFSFNDGFLKFCQSRLEPGSASKNTVHDTPPRIKELKKAKLIKSNPISIPNEAHLKRMPTQVQSLRNDGSFSKLTIGPNNTRQIKHGNGSLFKNPIVRSCDQNALREALASSFLD
ncbi:hypothetical protein Cantr_05629 [Candida viswanathii]|uniref:Uncharacterized protein n=1 Tax=Candida viswanathii TaxID=5486 RepID=A0A367XT40_9ASCO|nr:hypothetical protein Cantr_05629 [Candida viswanathii]